MTETVRTRSTRNPLRRDSTPDSAEVSAKPPLKKRIRPIMLIGGIALILACSLLAVNLVQSAGKYQSVLTIGQGIKRGEVISSNSLSSIDIAAGQNFHGYTVDQANDLVGKIAIVDMPAGSIVTNDSVASELLPNTGSSIVSISLKPEQTPARPFVAGDPIRLIDTGGGTAGSATSTRGSDVPGTIVTVKVDPVSNNTVLDVSVKNTQASDVAARIARGSVAVVVDATNTGDRK